MQRTDDDVARTTFAGAGGAGESLAPPLRQSAAHPVSAILRLIAAPLVAVAAALAGLLFAALLPICGIATISEGIAKASWRFVRESFAQLPWRQPHRT